MQVTVLRKPPVEPTIEKVVIVLKPDEAEALLAHVRSPRRTYSAGSNIDNLIRELRDQLDTLLP